MHMSYTQRLEKVVAMKWTIWCWRFFPRCWKGNVDTSCLYLAGMGFLGKVCLHRSTESTNKSEGRALLILLMWAHSIGPPHRTKRIFFRGCQHSSWAIAVWTRLSSSRFIPVRGIPHGWFNMNHTLEQPIHMNRSLKTEERRQMASVLMPLKYTHYWILVLICN